MFPGYLDLTELTTFLDRSDSVMHLAGTAPRFLEQLDVDGDGVVSLAEWISLWRRTKAAAGVQKTKGHYRFFHRAIEVAKQKQENQQQQQQQEEEEEEEEGSGIPM